MFRLYDTDGNGVLDTNVSKESYHGEHASANDQARERARSCSFVKMLSMLSARAAVLENLEESGLRQAGVLAERPTRKIPLKRSQSRRTIKATFSQRQ